jgi:hypothetical protein
LLEQGAAEIEGFDHAKENGLEGDESIFSIHNKFQAEIFIGVSTNIKHL